jgi:hypothetical protein
VTLTKTRIAIIATGLVLVAAAAATWWFVSSLDRKVQAIVERDGSALTGTRVRVSSVHVSLRDGVGTLRGLRIANPADFSDADAVRIETLTLRLDLATITKTPLTLKELVIEAPRVNLEVNASGKTNLDALRKAIERNAAAAPASDAQKLRILSAAIPSGRVDADMTAMGGGREEIPLDTIRLANVGGKSGATTDVVAKTIVTALVKETTRAASKSGLSRYLNGKTGGVGEKLKGLFKK